MRRDDVYANKSGYFGPTAGTAITRSGQNIHRPSEFQIQASLFEWVAWNKGKYPELELLHAIPNGEYRHPATAAKLKKQGVRAGVSDIFLPVARRGYHGVYIEIKAPNGRLSSAQKEWIEMVQREGFYAAVCYGTDAAVQLLEWYLNKQEALQDEIRHVVIP